MENKSKSIPAEKVSETIAKVMLPDVYPIVVDIERSFGNKIYNSLDGKNYIDCASYVASNPIGHNHPALFEPEFEKKLLRVAKTKPSSSDFYTVEKAEFVESFRTLAMPEGFRYLFFVEGGAVAVENAMKTAFDWKVRLNQAKFKKAGKVDAEKTEVGTQIIHFEQAFHGRCGYTLSVTNTADPRKTKFFPKFSWPRIVNPKVTFPLAENLQQVLALEQQALSQIETVLKNQGPDIAAILIETIQGEGGDNHFRPEFHHELRRLADEHEVFLIYDEVQTGGGSTGKMWAYEHYGIKPDIICFGKKFQVCGIIVGERVNQVENHVFSEASRINSTWGGNLTDMVRCQRYLEVIEAENLLQNAAQVGAYFVKQLQLLTSRYPQLLNNARGLGLFCALDAVSVAKRDEIIKEAFKRGAIILKCGVNSLRFRPALTFSVAEVDELMNILEDACKAANI